MKKKLFNIVFAFVLFMVGCNFNANAASSRKTKNKNRRISTTHPINVQCPVGTAPVLPWLVWVTYNDGQQEWRQTKWTNSATSTEKNEADANLNPVGTQYNVMGFILGDNTTEQGYPITAHVTVTDETNISSPTPKASPLPLYDVQLTGNNRFTHNRELDVEALLRINYKQMLYNYRDTYGLPTEGYPTADGWDSPTTKLKGHGTGHYLSALAFAYATEPKSNHNRRNKLLSTIKAMIDEMRNCQERTFVYDDELGRYREARDYAPEDILTNMKGNWAAFNTYKKDYAHYGYGYLNAIPAAHPALIECYRAYNNEEWVWAPYYTIHKQLAGLIDIATNVDDKEVSTKALLIAKDMGLWVWNRLHYRTYVKSDGTKQERQARPGNRYEMWNMYIAGEVGGMEESLARLSSLVSDPAEKTRLLEAATYFDSPAFFDPLTRNIDDVRTRHANQHIPMIVGALQTYNSGGDSHYYQLANNFWNMVQGRYVYATGGVGNGEMFRQPYSQILAMNTNVMSDWNRQIHPNPDLNETCCAYNLAKLTKDLNCFNPDDARYMDYYERVLTNQILGSINPEQYACTYQYAIGMNAKKPFGNETPQSTCCGGTGAENHVKYQEATYFVSDNTMWIAQYMPTKAYWREKDVYIEQESKWPTPLSPITFTIRKNNPSREARFVLKLRIPYWATSDMNSITLNGKVIANKKGDSKKGIKSCMPCSYVEIEEREWQDGDVVTLRLPYTTHLNFGPDKMDLAAVEGDAHKRFEPQWVGTLMYGPFAMATSDVTAWENANFRVNSQLLNISPTPLLKDDGTGGDLCELTMTDYTGTPLHWDQACPQTARFTPDYYQTGNSTHYLRLNLVGTPPSNPKEQLSINRQMLQSSMETAQLRKKEQETWQALAIKVPEYAPWAPYGYQRFLKEMEKAETINQNTKATAQEVGDALSALNAAINTMRPGNLAEPEDLSELLPLVTHAKNNVNKTNSLRDAINYAEMVIQYVNDGSGTHDLIRKAISRLQNEMQK